MEGTQTTLRTLTEPIDDDAVTVYDGMTLGQIAADRDKVYTRNRELEAQTQRQEKLLVNQSGRLAKAEEKVRSQQEELEKLRAQPAPVPAPKLSMVPFEKLPDGSVRVTVTIPEEQATAMLSWAQEAGEDPGKYLATCATDALIQYSAAAYNPQ